jgi:hypothetical protein
LQINTQISFICTSNSSAEINIFVTAVGGIGMGDILLHMKQNVGTRYFHVLQMKAIEQELLMPIMEINGHCASVLTLSL